MIESMIMKVKEIYPNLREKFHLILIPIATKINKFLTNDTVNVSLKFSREVKIGPKWPFFPKKNPKI